MFVTEVAKSSFIAAAAVVVVATFTTCYNETFCVSLLSGLQVTNHFKRLFSSTS